MRDTYQKGSVVAIRRAGVDRWAFRWYERMLDGTRRQRSVTFADIEKCPTKAAAQRLADKTIRLQIQESSRCIYFDQLADRYEAEDMPTRKSTAGPYRSALKRLRAKFGRTRLDHMGKNPLEIQCWLGSLTSHLGQPLTPKSKKNLKALLHRIFECAMTWGYIEIARNPIELVRLKHSPAHRSIGRKPTTLTTQEFAALLADEQLAEHCKTMVIVAMCTGLRASEFLGLKWSDVDFDAGFIYVRRSVVGKHEDLPKTESSAADVPMHPHLAEALLGWSTANMVVGEWVFGSALTGRPFHRDALLKDHLQPAGKRAGMPRLGWHSFRHTYRAMLAELELPLEVQKELMRHRHIETTLKYGAQSERSHNKNRAANARVVEMLPVRRMA